MIAASLRAVLTRVIDYAGMFPPASLSLDESIRNYARYVKDPDAWMLGRFICPAGKLSELVPYVRELFGSCSPLRLSALGRGGNSGSELVANLKLDRDDIEAFRKDVGTSAVVDVFELRTGKLAYVTFSFETDTPILFLEYTATSKIHGDGTGFKLRTGGTDSSAFPPVDQVAFALATCRHNKIPIKFTAGLHHPIRHFNQSVNTKMHGFINVFVAGVLAHAMKLSEQQLVLILEDEDPASFRFEDDTLRWRDYRATTQQVTAARKELVTSFGSCSFDEPRADLRSLGWL